MMGILLESVSGQGKGDLRRCIPGGPALESIAIGDRFRDKAAVRKIESAVGHARAIIFTVCFACRVMRKTRGKQFRPAIIRRLDPLVSELRQPTFIPVGAGKIFIKRIEAPEVASIFRSAKPGDQPPSLLFREVE